MEEGEVDDVDRMGTDLSYGTNDTDSGDTPRSRQKVLGPVSQVPILSSQRASRSALRMRIAFICQVTVLGSI